MLYFCHILACIRKNCIPAGHGSAFTAGCTAEMQGAENKSPV